MHKRFAAWLFAPHSLVESSRISVSCCETARGLDALQGGIEGVPECSQNQQVSRSCEGGHAEHGIILPSKMAWQ